MKFREIVTIIESDDSGEEEVWNYLVLQNFDETGDEILLKGSADSAEDAKKNVLSEINRLLGP
jgi:hypothetical protein